MWTIRFEQKAAKSTKKLKTNHLGRFESWSPVARMIVSALIMLIRLYQVFTPS